MSLFLLMLLTMIGVLIVAMLGVLVFAGIKLLRTYELISDPRMDTAGRAAFWGAVLYTLSPIDLLPDPILLDDIALVLLATAFIRNRADELGIGRGRRRPDLPVDRFGGIDRGSDDIIDVEPPNPSRPDIDDYWGWPRPGTS